MHLSDYKISLALKPIIVWTEAIFLLGRPQHTGRTHTVYFVMADLSDARLTAVLDHEDYLVSKFGDIFDFRCILNQGRQPETCVPSQAVRV
jgi:hypothetical protein